MGFLRAAISAAIAINIVAIHAAAKSVPVDSPAVQFSPGLWIGDSGRAGSKFRETWNNGAWVKFDWISGPNGTAAVRIGNAAGGSYVSYFVDGRLTDAVPVTADGSIEIKDLTAGDHELVLYTRNSRQRDRWDPKIATPNRYRVTGFDIDDGSTPRPITAHRPWVLVIGDSITEGNMAGPDGHDTSITDWAFLVGRGLDRAGYDTSVNACGWSGWVNPGDETQDVPGYFLPDDKGRWDKIDAATSLLDKDGHISGTGQTGDEPAMILFNYGTNEVLHGKTKEQMQTAIEQSLAALKKAAPKAKIVILIPPGLYDQKIYPTGPAFVEAIKAAVKPDERVSLIDLGPDAGHAWASPVYGGGVHPNAAGQAYVAPMILEGVLKQLPRRER
jgi:hypothetical protein